MPSYDYIDAHCGSGKTEAAIKHVSKRIQAGERYIIVQPTVLLIQQTEKRLKSEISKLGSVLAIHNEDGQADSVTKRLHSFLTKPGTIKVLLITFQAWKMLKRRELPKWNLIVDEAPAVFDVTSFNSKSVAKQLLAHLDFAQSDEQGDRIVNIKKGSKQKLIKLIEEARTDDALKVLSETAQAILAGMKTYVSEIIYDEFVNGKGKQITFYHFIKPSIFSDCKSVTIMSANFPDTTLYHIWKHLGVKFNRLETFGGVNLESIHPEAVGNALDIYYLVDKWSALRKKDNINKNIFEAEFRRAIKEVFEDQKFIHTTNTSDNKFLLQGFSMAQHVNPRAHGINNYRDFHCAAVYAHFNHSGDRVGFLERKFNIKPANGWNLLNRDNYYQFICRVSLRETPSADFLVAPKKIVLMDKSMAEYLQTKFPGSRIHKFESKLIDEMKTPKLGRKPEGSKPLTNAERTKRSRMKHKAIDLDRKLSIINGSINDPKDDKTDVFCNEMPLDNRQRYIIKEINEGRRWSLSEIGNIYDMNVRTNHVDGFGEIVSLLKQYSSRHIIKKEMNLLFNMTEFGSDRNRQRSNVRHSDALLLDMDSVMNCCPKGFADFCSGLEMVLYSSFKSALDHRRWRALIPFSRKVTEAEYNHIAKDMIELSKINGFPFDKQKVRANDFMYLPCHGKNEDAFFFEHVSGEERKQLDVDLWLGIVGLAAAQ